MPSSMSIDALRTWVFRDAVIHWIFIIKGVFRYIIIRYSFFFAWARVFAQKRLHLDGSFDGSLAQSDRSRTTQRCRSELKPALG